LHNRLGGYRFDAELGRGITMKILVACEESQAVTKRLRALGHEAYSCDIQECSGGHPEWHILGDVVPELEKHWDMIIAFPPCTDLAVSGAAWFEQKRKDGRQQASIDFFMLFANANCERIAIENPVGIMSSHWRKPDQIIHPYLFGDAFEKKTCLWLKGLPKLEATNIVEPPKRTEFASGRSMPTWYADAWRLKPKERAKLRSKTFDGIAQAMAEQWAGNA
jgi:site-specific DNA-cytosine methylase